MARFAPRLHVLLARDSAVGLVIRRGPSKLVATILWDRRRDEFRLGQWLKGRIYERRSDISPDGKYFIYFAMNGQWNSESLGSWTAISRVPFLKAIAFFPKGDCWNGGGLWTGRATYWLNDGYGHQKRRDTSAVRRDHEHQPAPYYGGECLGVYYHRLRRDGWTLVENPLGAEGQGIDSFEKRIGEHWILRKIAHSQMNAPPGKGCYWDEHELLRVKSSEGLYCPTWEWADVDGRRLVWAAGGKLYAGKLQKHGLAEEVVLHDFNDMGFEAVEAPY